MNESVRRIGAGVLRRVAGRERFQPLFSVLLDTALRGMNFVGEDVCASGELAALRRVHARHAGTDGVTLLDVGAHRGEWAAAAASTFGRSAKIYAFEPQTDLFATVVDVAKAHPGIVPIRAALSDAAGSATLFADQPGSGLASLIHRDLQHHGRQMHDLEEVTTMTVDDFALQEGIERITLMKLDVEGAELAVLRGATRMLAGGRIEAIQFEFGGTNIDSRTYLRDFFDVLHEQYRISRVLQDGAHELPAYSERDEIFLTVNYLAERR